MKKNLIKFGKFVAIIYLILPLIFIFEYAEDFISICFGILIVVSYGFFLWEALEKTDEKITDIFIKKNNNIETPIEIMEETINNAKKDLETGIKKEELDKMLENGSITEEKYNEILQSIKTLEMLSNFDINKLKENDKSTKN